MACRVGSWTEAGEAGGGGRSPLNCEMIVLQLSLLVEVPPPLHPPPSPPFSCPSPPNLHEADPATSPSPPQPSLLLLLPHHHTCMIQMPMSSWLSSDSSFSTSARTSASTPRVAHVSRCSLRMELQREKVEEGNRGVLSGGGGEMEVRSRRGWGKSPLGVPPRPEWR